jgi:hypothetical protein
MILGEQKPGQAADMSGLTEGEHLLVRSWRRIAAERTDCPSVSRAFEHTCGEDAAEVLATFCTFLRALAYAGRRLLRVGHPGCASLTRDERQLLTIIAAAQSGDDALFTAHLCWLARVELRPALTIATGALGTALAMHGYLLPLPEAAPAQLAIHADPTPQLVSARFKVY